MTAAAVVGGTGLIGGIILTQLLSHPSISTVAAFARRPLTSTPDPHSRLRPLVDSDSANWPADFSSFSPQPHIFFSGLGTTRGAAGGFDNQYKIDFDLNLALAKAAKEAGVKVYVLISSAGSSRSSYNGYLRMKAELEDAVKDVGFDKCVIVKPGLIVGQRTESRPAEWVLRVIATGMGKISGGYLKDFWAQDADVIGKAAVSAGLKALQGEAPEGPVWFVGQSDVLRLGRKEWK